MARLQAGGVMINHFASPLCSQRTADRAARRPCCRWPDAAASPVDCATRDDDRCKQQLRLQAARGQRGRRSDDELRSLFVCIASARRAQSSLAPDRCISRAAGSFGEAASSSNRCGASGRTALTWESPLVVEAAKPIAIFVLRQMDALKWQGGARVECPTDRASGGRNVRQTIV